MAWSTADIPDLSGRIAVVTGPTVGGLGWFTAAELARQGALVVLAGRSWERLDAAEKAIREDVPAAKTEKVAIDLSDLQSVRAGAAAINDVGAVHLLINNAGVMATPQQRTVDDLDLQMATNHFGPFLLTGLLLPTLAESGDGRVISVSSPMHRMARRAPLTYPTVAVGRYHPWEVYSQSKLANLLFTYELERRLRKAGLPVRAIGAHPGVASTRLVANGPMGRYKLGNLATIAEAVSSAVSQPPEAGARPLLMAATDALPGGTFVGPAWEMGGPPRVVGSSRLSHDPDAARALWELSEQTTGIAYP